MLTQPPCSAHRRLRRDGQVVQRFQAVASGFRRKITEFFFRLKAEATANTNATGRGQLFA